jgi:NAD(P)-dependent dehydrogenase (short-subunit alcohol dehydrogenase family)
MGVTWSQFFPPAPTITEASLPSQEGRVFIVTGGYSGVGFELCAILYRAGGKVYLAGRDEEKGLAAIVKIKAQRTTSSVGDIVFLKLLLDDLASIKPAVATFTAAESRLDVLFNNAGVSNPPRGSVSAQGHELQLSTNCLGPHLLTQLLLPTLRHTAAITASGSVRVIWTSSMIVDLSAPTIGIELAELEHPHTDQQHNYVNTKVGNWFLANTLANQAGKDGILSLVQNPGNLKTDLTRHLPAIVPIVTAPLLYPARNGAYTALWAAFSDRLTIQDGGKYILPWGRLHPNPREDLLVAMKSKEDGGTGIADGFMEYCDKQIAGFT